MEQIVFTNGCFDIIHPGHIDLLKQARNLGTKLIVGINSDRSVREIKGSTRPLLNQEARAAILRELRSVDEVRIFDENTPERIIKEIKPHVLVKGGDWQSDQIIGADFVLENGGRVFSIPFKQSISTSQIVEKMRADKKSDINKEQNSETLETDQNFSTSIGEIFRLSEFAHIQRAAEVIADVLSKGGRIYLADFSGRKIAAELLAEDLKRYFGDEKIFLLADSNILETDEEFLDAENLLIGVSSEEIREDFAEIIMKGRQKNLRILLLTDESNRKLAALSDVCMMFRAESLEERLWKQRTIGYLWFRAIKLQKSFF